MCYVQMRKGYGHHGSILVYLQFLVPNNIIGCYHIHHFPNGWQLTAAWYMEGA